LAFEPRNVKLMQVLSVEYSRGRYFHEAAAIARQALRLAPSEQNLYFLALKAYQDAGDQAAAALLATEAATRFPASARAQFEHGYYLQKAGNTATGMKYLQRAMELDDRYEEPYFFSGDLLVKQSQWEPSLAPLRKAIAIRPEYSPARVALARALSNLNRSSERPALGDAVASVFPDGRRGSRPHRQTDFAPLAPRESRGATGKGYCQGVRV